MGRGENRETPQMPELHQVLDLRATSRGAAVRRTVPGAVAGTAAEVRAGAAPGEDPPDRIRAVCRRTAGEAWRREARNLQFSGVYSHLWEPTIRPADSRRAERREAQSTTRGTARASARLADGGREMAGPGSGATSNITPSQATGLDSRYSATRFYGRGFKRHGGEASGSISVGNDF